MSDDVQQELPSVFDFSEKISDAEPPEPLPIGRYPATISGVEPKRSSTSGKIYADVVFNVDPADYPADFSTEDAPDGKKLHYRFIRMEDDKVERSRLRKFCDVIGADTNRRQIDLNEWVGLDAVIVLNHGEFEGEVREEIVRVEPS